MTTPLPDSHLADIHELESKGIRDLFKIELRNSTNSVIRITPHNEIVYQGQTWEYLPCKLSEISQNSTGEQSRPKFSTVNPEGLFSSWLQQGFLDGAVLTRYRILLPDLEANNAAYVRNLWIISRVISLNKQLVTLELRSTMDGAGFMLPYRTFYPPAFPHVSLR